MHLPDKWIYLGSVGLCIICLSLLWYVGMQRDNFAGSQVLGISSQPYIKTMADGRKITKNMLYAEVWAPKVASASDAEKFADYLVEQKLRQVAERENEDAILVRLYRSEPSKTLVDRENYRQEIYYCEKGSWSNVTAKLNVPQSP